MSLVIYANQALNYYCGFFLAWKTCNTFQQIQDNQKYDTLLIKWFLLYFFIQIEGIVQLIAELLPFGWLIPMIVKVYIIMPHSKWHSLIYDFFDKLEMDEQTNQMFIYLQRGTRILIVKLLGIIETYIDIIRVDELQFVEEQLNTIQDKLVRKKSSIEIRKSMIRIRNSTIDGKLSTAKSQPQFETVNFAESTNASVYVPGKNKYKIQAQVLDQGRFKQFILQFIPESYQLTFRDIDTEDIVYKKTLIYIDLDEGRSLKLQYEDNDNNLNIIKLQKPEQVQTWLEPILEILIEKNQNEQNIQNNQ